MALCDAWCFQLVLSELMLLQNQMDTGWHVLSLLYGDILVQRLTETTTVMISLILQEEMSSGCGQRDGTSRLVPTVRPATAKPCRSAVHPPAPNYAWNRVVFVICVSGRQGWTDGTRPRRESDWSVTAFLPCLPPQVFPTPQAAFPVCHSSLATPQPTFPVRHLKSSPYTSAFIPCPPPHVLPPPQTSFPVSHLMSCPQLSLHSLSTSSSLPHIYIQDFILYLGAKIMLQKASTCYTYHQRLRSERCYSNVWLGVLFVCVTNWKY